MQSINEFKGQHRFLSNFYMVPVEFEHEIYPSSEHAYMAAKTEVFALRKQIAACATPAEAKKMGRSLKLRDGWEAMKYDVMLTILRSKFSSSAMQYKLLLTGDAELVEGNWWGDKIWGVCLKTNQGQNLLGKALMQVRKELQSHLLPTITVVNKHHKAEGEYIGRGSPLGNKWTHLESKHPDVIKVATREEAVQHYKTWLDRMIANNDEAVCNELNRLVDIAHEKGELKLQCFCSPLACHGDVIKQTILTAWSK